MAKIVIDTDICFECDEPAEENHHVIPKSRGGNKTIPLCVKCHCKVHGLKNRPEHRRLTIEGLKRAKERGVVLGKPENLKYEHRVKGAQKKRIDSLTDEKNLQIFKIIDELKQKGLNYEQITKELNKIGVPTYKGKIGCHTSGNVARLYRKFKNN